jgi:Zn-dependent protease
MGRSLRIGSAFGIGLYVHWSFLLVLGFIALVSGASGVGDLLLSVGFTLGLFACVLLHELGHALMARSYGIGTRDITLLPIGGVARLERMSEHPREEIAIAVAGPLVNVVIAAGLWLGMVTAGLSPFVLSRSHEMASAVSNGHGFLALLFQANVGLVLFNMIPAFPMDGGRVFRALLSLGVGRLRGTEIAVALSKVVALLFIAAGLWWGQYFLPVIGVFVMVAGNQELAMLRYQDQRRRQRLIYDQTPTVIPVDQPAPSAPSPRPDFSGFVWDPRAGAWVEWRNGQVVGATYVNGTGPSW